jgi:hypothetical protein
MSPRVSAVPSGCFTDLPPPLQAQWTVKIYVGPPALDAWIYLVQHQRSQLGGFGRKRCHAGGSTADVRALHVERQCGLDADSGQAIQVPAVFRRWDCEGITAC